MNKQKEFALAMLKKAGVTVNGQQPWDINVKNEGFFQRALSQGTLGLGESYMDGWWEVKSLDQFIYRLLQADSESAIKPSLKVIASVLFSKLTNYQTKSKSKVVGEKHYDLGNDLFSAMLDKRMTYTCAYWKGANTLDEAQVNKLELVCQKMNLKPGMRVLDIGCGWGSFLKYASEKYGVSGIGVTISEEQVKLGNELNKDLPVEIRLQDYRDVSGNFDRVVSLGMFEHVGYKNYRTFFNKVKSVLKPDGLALLHTIGGNKSVTDGDPWAKKYIFPFGMIPSLAQISKSLEKTFIIEDVHNFGADYDKTLMAWYENFNRHWPELQNKYGDRFYRMWKYYLLACAGMFRARDCQLWQIVLSPTGVKGGYKSIR
jgi:cyclopropane-fatty-acyl-phospholipid synthase